MGCCNSQMGRLRALRLYWRPARQNHIPRGHRSSASPASRISQVYGDLVPVSGQMLPPHRKRPPACRAARLETLWRYEDRQSKRRLLIHRPPEPHPFLARSPHQTSPCYSFVEIRRLANDQIIPNPSFGEWHWNDRNVPLPVNHQRPHPRASPGLFCPIMELFPTSVLFNFAFTWSASVQL